MGQDIVDKFSTHLKNVLTRALCFVVEQNKTTIEPEHLLWALGTQKGSIGAEILHKTGVKQTELCKLAKNVQSTTTTKINGNEKILLHLSDDAKRSLEKAVLTANIYGHRYVGTEHLLSGILQINSLVIETFFLSAVCDMKELRTQISLVLKSATTFPDMVDIIAQDPAAIVTQTQPMTTQERESNQKMTALSYFARELTSKDLQSRIDPVIGREKEIERMMEILTRRTKNNPLLVGEPGVGKTAIVEGLAKRIFEGTAAPILQHKRI